MPGSGTYEPNTDSQKPKAAGYSMGIKLKSDLVKTTGVPGPGQYVQDNEKLKQSAPKFGFGSEKRGDPLNPKFKTPGPGSYHMPMALGARWDPSQE